MIGDKVCVGWPKFCLLIKWYLNLWRSVNEDFPYQIEYQNCKSEGGFMYVYMYAVERMNMKGWFGWC